MEDLRRIISFGIVYESFEGKPRNILEVIGQCSRYIRQVVL